MVNFNEKVSNEKYANTALNLIYYRKKLFKQFK